MNGDRNQRSDRLRRTLLELADAEQRTEWLARLWSDDTARDQLLCAAENHGLASTLHDRLVELGATPPAALATSRHGATARRLAARTTLARLGAAFDAAELPWLTCKGAVVAARHERPEHREFNDLDLLVPGPRLAEAIEVAASVGVESVNRNWAAFADHGVGELPLVHTTVWIDLHWHLIGLARARRRFAVDPVAMLGRRRSLDLGDTTVAVFDTVDEVLHLALHAGLGGGGRLAWLRDVRVVVAANRPDWGALVAEARSARIAAIVGLVLDRSRRLVGAEVPDGVIESLVPRSVRALIRRVDDRPASAAVSARRIGSGSIVRTVRDDPISTMLAAGAEVEGQLRARTGRPHRWDVADPGGTLHWATTSGGDADRDRYFELAATP